MSCRVKFGAFYEYLAKQQDGNFDRIASGHYAKIIRADNADEPVRLALAPDAVKDQTYFLAHLTQQQLSKAMFPLGHLTKVLVMPDWCYHSQYMCCCKDMTCSRHFNDEKPLCLHNLPRTHRNLQNVRSKGCNPWLHVIWGRPMSMVLRSCVPFAQGVPGG